MSNTDKPFRVTSLAPQFLVDDLDRSIKYYRDAPGFTFEEPWGGFYAIGLIDGLELHLKASPKNTPERIFPPQQRSPRCIPGSGPGGGLLRKMCNERRPGHKASCAYGVGHEGFLRGGAGRSAEAERQSAVRDTRDFYVEDPDGYILCFGGN